MSATNARNNGCPLCSCSKGEKSIKRALESLGIKYIPQYKFDDLIGVGGRKLSYDFFVPSMNCLIEYQGIYHDKDAHIHNRTENELLSQLEHDKRKREYAESLGYNFVEIWYFEKNRIDEIIKNLVCAYANP